jgi:hypothetical protein
MFDVMSRWLYIVDTLAAADARRPAKRSNLDQG